MLRLCDIVKNYNAGSTTVQALRGVSLAFREAEFVAILGPSGCGKTTMLNIIGGLDRYTSGDLVIGGVSTAAFDDLHWDAYRNATIGFVFQSYNLIPHLTVMENVELALSLVGEKKKTRRAKVVAALHRVGMGDEINKRPNQLSGGQMQRVAIARAIVNDPKIILADEPTGALDSELSVQVMDILKDIAKTRLVIMVTHNADLAYQYCSRICKFKDGSLIEDTNPYDPEEEALEMGFDVLGLHGNAPSAEEEDLEKTEEIAEADEVSSEAAQAGRAERGFAENLTTDTLSLQNEQINEEIAQEGDKNAATEEKPNEGAEQEEGEGEEEVPVADDDDIDISGLFSKTPIVTKIKKVSNRKRKKQMKRNSSAQDPVLNKLGINSLNKRKHRQKKQMKKEKTFKPTSMSAGMAFGLSLRNLIAKRRRTFFTAFAGSIGIIGLGLVLAISNGFKVYVNKMQTEMLAGVPVGVYEYNVQVSVLDDIMSSMAARPVEGEDAFPDSDKITVDKTTSSEGGSDAIAEVLESFFKSVTRNKLTSEFVDYMSKYDGGYGAMNVFYGTRYNLINRYYGDSGWVYQDVSQTPSVADAMSIAMTILGESGLQAKYWQQLIGDEAFMKEAYDVLGGTYPKNMNQIALCVNERNQINGKMLEAFGIKLVKLDADGKEDIDPETGKPIELQPDEITIDSFIGRKIRLVMNNDYYIRDEGEEFFREIPYTSSSDKEWRYDDQQTLKEIYEKADPSKGGTGIDLEICGVLRPKKDAPAAYVMTSALCYTPELAKYVADNASNSEVAKFQREMKAKDDKRYYRTDTSGNPTGCTIFGRNDRRTDNDIKGISIGVILNNKLALTSYEKAIGADPVPNFIAVYPKTYQQKIDICKYLDKWNKTHKTDAGADAAGYFDVSDMVVHSLNMMINLVSVLLIAVASISLVVSTVMIGVITSNSVIERTREIGILRALGARKRDIRNVFVAETALIGLAAGLLGIIITYILCPLISLVIGAIAGVSNLLNFHPLHALLLVALSFVLTVISGIIPAIGASRKNVVDALRVE